MSSTSKRRRRKRNLLRDYYGTLEEKKEEEKVEEPKEDEHSPLDIDHSSFDPQAYFEDLLQRQGVKQLISTDQEMRKEIKQLDSDMKTLVYENYNKFISATDTIRNMKKNVENMEEEMNSLEQNMEKISECTERINQTLAPKRDKIKELNGVYRLLIKRQFLFELPSRLKQSIEMGSYNQAVSYYNKTHGVLQKYSDITSFASILRECEEIIAKLKEILSERAGNTRIESPAIVESVALLLDLNEPSDKLRRDYCRKHGALIFWVLKEAPAKMELFLQNKKAQENKESEETNQNEDLFFDFLRSINNEFISTYLHFCGSYSNLFIARETSQQERDNANEEIQLFSQQVFDEYHSIAKNILLNMGQRTSTIVQGLSIIKSDMSAISSEFSNVGNIIHDAISDITNRTIKKLSNRAFNILTKNIERHVIGVCECVSKIGNFAGDEPQGPLSQFPTDLNNVLVDEIENFIGKLKVLFIITPSTSFLSEHSGIFFTKLVVDVQKAILLITRFIVSLLGKKERLGKKDTFNGSEKVGVGNIVIGTTSALVLAKTCQHFASSSVAHLQDILHSIAVLPHQKTENKINVLNLERKLRVVTKQLLSHYVRCQGQKISQMIRKGIEAPNWLKAKEPRDVRPGIVIVVDEIKLMNKEVLTIFEKKKEVDEGNSVGGIRSSRSRFDQGIAELFEKKVKIFGAVDPDPDSIMFAILKISLKSYFECVQLQTFSIHGYQQIQVDTSFIALLLRPIAAKDTLMFERLIEEILNSGADRCLDPQSKMETSIVNSICQHKIKQLEEHNMETIKN